MTFFQTHKLNYEILLQAGWDHKTLAQLQKALVIKEKRGYQACTKTQQRLLRTWRPAQEKVHADMIAFAKANNATGKDLEDKDHVQWLKLAEMATKAQLDHQLLEGEQASAVIVHQEHLYSVRQLRPTLSRTDTQVRRKVEGVVHPVTNEFECVGRKLEFDMDEFRRFMKANWVGNWSDKWELEHWDGPVFALDAEWAPEFRAEVRKQLALKAPQIWVSLRK